MIDSLDSKRSGVLAAGTWALDRITLVNQWPEEEHLADIVGTDRQGGGCGYNLALNVKKLAADLPVYAAGRIGDDEDGQFLLHNAHGLHIDTRQLHLSREVCTAYTEVISAVDTGKRTFFHHRGSSDTLTPECIDVAACDARILHLGLLGLHAQMDATWHGDANGWVTVLKAAQSAGMHTNLELVSIAAEQIQQVADPCLAHLDSLIINEYELSALARMPVTDADGHVDQTLCLLAAESVLQKSSAYLIVVHHPDAAMAITRDAQRFHKPSLAVPQSAIVSSVGAGDAFSAGFLFALHEGWDISEALSLAHSAAAISLTSATTVGGMLPWQQCLVHAEKLSYDTEPTTT